MTRVYLTQALEKVEAAAKKVIADVAEGDMLRTQLAIVRRLSKHEPFNTIAAAAADLRRRRLRQGSTRWRRTLTTLSS